MYKPNAEPSVHLTLLPEGFEKFRDDVLAVRWETIRNVRRVVTGALELERAAKNIGSSLEASPLVYVSDNNIFNTLFDVDLAEVCITSNAMVTNDDAPASAFRLGDVPGVAVVVEKAVGTKCARSWKILPTVGEDSEYPDVSPRDAQALREWKALAEGEKPADAVEEPAEPVGLIEPQQPAQDPVEATPEQAGPDNVTVGKPAKKVRARKTVKATEADEARSAGDTRKVAAARKTSEANKAAEASTRKAKKAKKAKAKKVKTKKAKAKKAGVKKAAKSRRASSATRKAKKGTAKATAKKAKAKKTTKKAGKKSAATKPTKKKKKKAR
jgi:isoleucyl-tRNA synthetase